MIYWKKENIKQGLVYLVLALILLKIIDAFGFIEVVKFIAQIF